MSAGRPGRLLAAVALLTSALAVHDASLRPAGALVTAPVGQVQAGTVAKVAAGTVAPTLPASSRAGTLLVATLTSQRNANFTGPTGWVRAIGAGRTNARAEIWYYANNPGGITSASFANTGATSTAGQLSEWSGVVTSSPLDRTGSATSTLASSVTPTTTAATTVTGELAVTAAALYILLPSATVFTPGANWSNLGNSGATSSSYQYNADYRIGLAAGSVGETISSSDIGGWGAVVATFKPVTCQGGSRTVTAPSGIAFPAVTLAGTDQTATVTAALTPSDISGSAAGWNVQATSTTFRNTSGRTLPTTATRVTAATVSATGATCDLPASTVGYPVVLPAGGIL